MSLVGHHIGRYRILEKIGSGGMSVVYKGLDTALDREVAVKVLHPHLAGKADSRRRLEREAQAVAKLQHPNILEVFDFVSGDSETAYIVTEFIRGQTLKHYAEKRAFYPPEIAAMVIHEVAAALSHAHDLGIIHRDLKPENVMVRDDGVIKLMDFGIAKFLDREDQMTITGALVGSPAHMAPEIIEGQHEIGPELAEHRLEALGIRAHRDLVPSGLEDRLQVRGLLGIVLHRQDPCGMGLARVQEVLEAAHERLPVHGLLEIRVRASVDGLDLVQEPPMRPQDEHGHPFAARQRAELIDHVVARAVLERRIHDESIGEGLAEGL